MTNINENDLHALKNVAIGESLTVETADNNTYTLQVTERTGATIIGAGTPNGTPQTIELRYGRGADGDDDQPYCALGLGGKNSIETTNVETGNTHIEGIGDVNVTHEHGRISYDETVTTVTNNGQQTHYLGD